MTALPTVTKEYIPYIPGDYGELESEDSIDEEIDDYRYYEVIEGIKVPLHHHVRIVYENGVTQGEGTYLDGYKAGIWRFFNRNGILVSTGSYNERNERWRKWRLYEELDGKSCIQMMVDIRGSYERYWIYDMDGNLTHKHKISNLNAPIEDYMYETYFSKPTGRSWPSDF